MIDHPNKESLLEILTTFHFVADDCQIIVDDNDGVYVLPTFWGYFFENKRNRETIERLDQIFKEYLQEQFFGYPLAFQEILEAHLDDLLDRAYRNLGKDRQRILHKSERITLGFLRSMFKELKELVTVIGRTDNRDEELRALSLIMPLSAQFPSSVFVANEAKDRLFSIFKEMGDSASSEIVSLNKELYIPEMLVGEYLTKLANRFGFKDGELVKVPLVAKQKGDRKRKWQTIHYRVEVISLWKDVFAYGFIPEMSGVPPMLLFCSDYHPPSYEGYSFTESFSYLKSKGVGYFAYKSSEKQIESWLKNSLSQTDQKAIVLGYALGGALACYTTTYLHSLVQKGMTFNGVDVDEKTTRLWNEMEGDKDRPILHNFYLESDYCYRLSHQTVGENFDVLADMPTTQLERSLDAQMERDLVVCSHKSKVRRTAIQKLSSVAIPVIGDVCFEAILIWDWIGSCFSLLKK